MAQATIVPVARVHAQQSVMVLSKLTLRYCTRVTFADSVLHQIGQ